MKKFNIKSIVATIILALIVFVAIKYIAIPTPFINTTLCVYAAFVATFAYLFGPVVAFLGGFIGNLLVDLTSGWGVWWTWIFATGLFGLIVGIGCKNLNPNDGIFTQKEIVRYISSCVVGCIICWGVVAPLGDVIFYNETASEVFLQSMCIGLSATISSTVFGTILCELYALYISKKNKK